MKLLFQYFLFFSAEKGKSFYGRPLFLIVTTQCAFNLLSFQVFDFGLLWSWIRIGFQTRCVDIQVVAIASLTSTFYSCSLVTSLSCMTVAASCILCLKLACIKTNEMYMLATGKFQGNTVGTVNRMRYYCGNGNYFFCGN